MILRVLIGAAIAAWVLVGFGYLWAWWRRFKREVIESACPSSDEVFDPETEMTDAQ